MSTTSTRSTVTQRDIAPRHKSHSSTKRVSAPAHSHLLPSLPSPPLSSPSDHFGTDPWFDTSPSSASTSQTSLSIHQADHWLSKVYAGFNGPRSGSHINMTAVGSSITGLEGSWRIEGSGELPPVSLHRSTRYSQEPIWEVHDPAGPLHHIPSGPLRRRSSSPKRYAAGPLPTAVWADVMDTSKGRDKVLKCLQYSLRTYLYLLGLIAGVRPLNRWMNANAKRMKLATSGLSLTRKCLLLLNPLHPITELLSPTPTSASTLLGHLIELCSALSDDIYCLFRLGIVGKRTGKLADKWSNRFWLLTTVMGLYKLHLRTLPRLRQNGSEPLVDDPPLRKSKELRDVEWTNRKLIADLVFVSFDVFDLQLFKEPIQCAAGLLAAFISTSKLYDQHWRASLGKG